MVNKTLSDKMFRLCVGLVLGLFAFLTAYPFYIIIINSFFLRQRGAGQNGPCSAQGVYAQ